jgi:hypothetical protein
MLKRFDTRIKVLTLLGICAWIAPASNAADVRVNAVKLSVEVDRQSN